MLKSDLTLAMELEGQKQKEDIVRQILSEDSGESLRGRQDIVPPHSTRSERGESSSSEYNDRLKDHNINIAVDIVETDYQEVENEFANSILEIEGAKVFPCSKCSKICKSKGGLTKHTNSKHGDRDKASSSANTTSLCFDTIRSIVDTIKANIIAEKLYGDEINSAVKNISATEALLKEVLPLYAKFCRNRNQDKLLEAFYGLMLNLSVLLNCKDSRVANLVMIHIPDHLVAFCNVGLVGEKTLETADHKIQPSEHGPLSYIAGYVVSKLNKASKVKSQKKKTPELQALLQSLIICEEEASNEFILAGTRGGLVTPCKDIVRILYEAEICFRKQVNKTKVIQNIPVDAICFSTIHLPIVKSLWENIVLSSGVNPSRDINKLCLENIVKMFLKVRSFSYTKGYITQYKIKEKQGKKKALRKDFKQSSEV